MLIGMRAAFLENKYTHAPSFINSHSLFLVMPNHLGPFHKTPDTKEVSRTER
jgi:hypothetical protein